MRQETVPSDVQHGLRAAQYVRMSTDHQRYSTQNQADAIAAYAADRNLAIVRSYGDAGRSGLTLDGRDGLQSLINDVRCGRADFEFILVYDVMGAIKARSGRAGNQSAGDEIMPNVWVHPGSRSLTGGLLSRFDVTEQRGQGPLLILGIGGHDHVDHWAHLLVVPIARLAVPVLSLPFLE